MEATAERQFGDFVAARSLALRRFAYLLCGDWHQAEDAVQNALTKLYLRWERLDNPLLAEPYLRRILVTTLIDESRRGWFRRETVWQQPPDEELAADPANASADRLAVLAALTQIPARQRAVLVLRFWEDQSVEQVAAILGCAPGTVKSQTAHGLAKLRGILGDHRTEDET